MDKRTEERVRMSIPMEVTTSSLPRTAKIKTYDFSPGGAYVAEPIPVEVGECVLCSFHVPGKRDPLVYDARVVHAEGNMATGYETTLGFGVEFMNVSPKDLTAIRRLLWGVTELYDATLKENLPMEI